MTRELARLVAWNRNTTPCLCLWMFTPVYVQIDRYTYQWRLNRCSCFIVDVRGTPGCYSGQTWNDSNISWNPVIVSPANKVSWSKWKPTIRLSLNSHLKEIELVSNSLWRQLSTWSVFHYGELSPSNWSWHIPPFRIALKHEQIFCKPDSAWKGLGNF